MLTPQEVSSHAFPKAVMGGYNMASVDEFLDELTDDYTALYKENAALKAKLKVLVEKVEDYRATEDSMRATLLTAQKMADSIVKEAEAKRDEILARAQVDAQDRVGQLTQEIAENELRLEAGQKKLAAFITAVRDVCQKELEHLEQLPELPVEIVKAVEEESKPAPSADEIADSVLAGFDIPEDLLAEINAAGAEAAAEVVAVEEETEEPAAEAEAEAEEEEAEEKEEYPEGNPFESESEKDIRSTRRIDLSELKFGRNYSGKGK